MDVEVVDGVSMVRFDHPPVNALDLDVLDDVFAGGCVFAMAADIRLVAAGTIVLTELAVGAMFPMSALEICRHAMGTSTAQATLGAGTVDVATAAYMVAWLTGSAGNKPGACVLCHCRGSGFVRHRGYASGVCRASASRDHDG